MTRVCIVLRRSKPSSSLPSPIPVYFNPSGGNSGGNFY